MVVISRVWGLCVSCAQGFLLGKHRLPDVGSDDGYKTAKHPQGHELHTQKTQEVQLSGMSILLQFFQREKKGKWNPSTSVYF